MSANFKSHFKFNKQERSGIFFLLLILILIQTAYYFYSNNSGKNPDILRFDENLQHQIDSLKMEALVKDSVPIYPFNPNFITDFKAYTLGMSLQEIDRLHEFRASDKYVNSKEEFQEVTKVSDSLLERISPYFKFPDWTQDKTEKGKSKVLLSPNTSDVKMRKKLDLNSATVDDLRSINGIGEKLSARIVKFRDRLGGFLVDGQLYDVYYLEPEVADRVLEKFTVLNKPEIVRINVNTATAAELSKLTYIQKDVAQRIVNYRNLNGGIKSLNELSNIEGFPSDRIDRIALYLSL